MSERTKMLELPLTDAQAKAVFAYAKRFGMTRSQMANRFCYSLFGKKK